MPAVAMAMVVLLLGVLLWLIQRNDMEDQRVSLIKDILWVEQNIHFHLVSDEEKLAQIAADLAARRMSPDYLDSVGRALTTNNPEIVRLLLRDADGRDAVQVPPVGDGPGTGPGGEAAGWWQTFRLARSTGRPAWSPAFADAAAGAGWRVELHVPVFLDHRFAGMLVAVVSLDSLLTHHVPWWVAERYRVEIVDGDGTRLAAKSTVTSARLGPSHQVRLEPPGQGLSVVATTWADDNRLARNLLAAAIFALAVLALSSLGLMRRHLHRRRDAERALDEEHAFRKAMEDSLTVGMRARDLTGTITYVNPAFCRMVGWTPEELVGTSPPMPYWVPELADYTLVMHNRVLAGDAPRGGFEIQFRRRDATRFWALVYEAPLIDARGRHTGWMASIVDIADRKDAEEMGRQQQEKLQQTSRLIAMGEMASTLAHELNQPLSAIASYAAGSLNWLSAEQANPRDLVEPLRKIGFQAQRAGQIIRRIHDFVRKSEPQLAQCSLQKIVADTVSFLEPDAKKRGVTVALDLARDAAEVEADRVLLEQVILNLARNGIEAMANMTPLRRRLHIALAVEGDSAVVSVRDYGTGLSAEARASLFQPFFTTKAEGMGMGLNICRSIIEAHRGRLWHEPLSGDGTLFRFTLPLRKTP